MCGVIAVVSVLADHLIMDLLEGVLSSYSLASACLPWGAALEVYYWGSDGRNGCLTRFSATRQFFFLGVLLTAVSVGYLGAAMDNGSGHFPCFPTGGDLCRAGLYFSSVQVWVFALLSLGAWYGAEIWGI